MRPPLADPPTVGFAGRLVREKGVSVLLRAFARVRQQMPTARLLIAGAGPERAQLDSIIAELRIGEGVSIAERLAPEALELFLAPAWVQAVPSLWQEPFGLVAVEAMMRGTCVVASRVGGLSEIVRDPTGGRLVPPGDEEALVRALTSILARREIAEALGRTASEIAQRDFSEDTYVERFIDCYTRLRSASTRRRSISRLATPRFRSRH
jgi:glycosyltransferase involved in cell wall biosynthesis